MTKVQLHPEARKELDAARRYYPARDAEVGRRFAREALDLLHRVASKPRQFPKHSRLAVTGPAGTALFEVYKAVLPRTFPYALFFFMRSDAAIIIAVAHTRRRPGYWMRRGSR